MIPKNWIEIRTTICSSLHLISSNDVIQDTGIVARLYLSRWIPGLSTIEFCLLDVTTENLLRFSAYLLKLKSGENQSQWNPLRVPGASFIYTQWWKKQLQLGIRMSMKGYTISLMILVTFNRARPACIGLCWQDRSKDSFYLLFTNLTICHPSLHQGFLHYSILSNNCWK